MGTDDSGTATPTLQREVCDKCGSRMELESSAYGFERWKCPKCQQVVGIDTRPRGRQPLPDRPRPALELLPGRLQELTSQGPGSPGM